MSLFSRTTHPDEANDEILLERYRKDGDLQVLGRLYEKYVQLVYGVCLKYLTGEDDAKDAVMGIFEELVVKAKAHEVKQFRGWLYVLARNYCLMQLRSDKKMPTTSIDEQVMEFTADVHPDNKYSEEYMTVLERCMSKLPAGQRQSVDLFFLQEKCYKEIADNTGFTMNEVKSHLQNGKRNLKICIEKNRE